MLWLGPGNFVYKYSNQSSKYMQMGLFMRKVLSVPSELSIIVKRFREYSLVVLYLCCTCTVKQNVKRGEQLVN